MVDKRKILVAKRDGAGFIVRQERRPGKVLLSNVETGRSHWVSEQNIVANYDRMMRDTWEERRGARKKLARERQGKRTRSLREERRVRGSGKSKKRGLTRDERGDIDEQFMDYTMGLSPGEVGGGDVDSFIGNSLQGYQGRSKEVYDYLMSKR